MAEYNYTQSIPEGGFQRGVKYRNPHYFDGRPESDATVVSCDDGFQNIVDAYKTIGVQVNGLSADEQPEQPEEQEEQEVDTQQLEKEPSDMSDAELKAAYESKYGKKAGNMKRETLIMAITEEE